MWTEGHHVRKRVTPLVYLLLTLNWSPVHWAEAKWTARHLNLNLLPHFEVATFAYPRYLLPFKFAYFYVIRSHIPDVDRHVKSNTITWNFSTETYVSQLCQVYSYRILPDTLPIFVHILMPCSEHYFSPRYRLQNTKCRLGTSASMLEITIDVSQ